MQGLDVNCPGRFEFSLAEVLVSVLIRYTHQTYTKTILTQHSVDRECGHRQEVLLDSTALICKDCLSEIHTCSDSVCVCLL